MTVAFPYLLAFISLAVALGLYYKRNMWPWIVTYWIALTVKNIIDCIPK